MDSSSPALRAEPPAPAAADEDIDERIRRVELTLIDREERLRRDLDHIGKRLRALLEPRRWLVPAVGVAAAGAARWLALRRRPWLRRSAAQGASGSDAGRDSGRPSGRGRHPWLHMATLALPLLPAVWRERLTPSGAMKWGFELMKRDSQRHTGPPPQTVAQVDPARLSGDWVELARWPATHDQGASIVSYTLRDDGFDVLQRILRSDGGEHQVTGAARSVPGSDGVKWEFTDWPQMLRWLPLAWSERWILHVDDDYGVALLGSPRRDFLCILSRTPDLAAGDLQRLVELARREGYAVEQLQRRPV